MYMEEDACYSYISVVIVKNNLNVLVTFSNNGGTKYVCHYVMWHTVEVKVIEITNTQI